VICDNVLATDGLAAAVNGLSDVLFGGADALYLAHAVTTAQTPQAIENALIEADARMVAAAKRYVASYPGAKAESEHVGRVALRRTNATHGDLSAARAVFEAEQAAKKQAVFERSYRQPDSLATIIRRRIGMEPAEESAA
jgi:hypothetical protein